MQVRFPNAPFCWVLFSAFTSLLVSGCRLEGIPASSWQEVKSENGQFRIDMPGAPTEGVQEWKNLGSRITFQKDESVQFFSVLFPGQLDTAFVLQYFDLKPGVILNREKVAKLVATAFPQATVEQAKKITFQGIPAWEYDLSQGDSIKIVRRIYLNGDRVYLLTVASSHYPRVDTHANRFFDSFRLL